MPRKTTSKVVIGTTVIEADEWKVTMLNIATPVDQKDTEGVLKPVEPYIDIRITALLGREAVSEQEHQVRGVDLFTLFSGLTTGLSLYDEIKKAAYVYSQSKGWIPSEAT